MVQYEPAVMDFCLDLLLTLQCPTTMFGSIPLKLISAPLKFDGGLGNILERLQNLLFTLKD